MAKPFLRQTIVKKRIKKFPRANADSFKRLAKTGWRRPRGIDSKVRQHVKGATLTPRIGYGSAKATKHVCPDGFRKFLIRNPNELNMLIMQNKRYSCEISASVGSQKRKEIVQRARELDIKVTKPRARLREEPKL